MRSRIGTAVMVAVLAAGGSLAVAEPAGAADVHTVTVAPNTGLADGQTVTVSGTGFDETPIINDWAVIMCSSAILSEPLVLTSALRNCDGTTQPFAFVHADPAGNLSTSYSVRKSFSTGGGPVTCGQAPNDCAILVSQLVTGGNLVGAAAPISFGPPVKTLGDCIRDFLNDHERGLRARFHRLLVCIYTVLTQSRPR